MKIGYILKIIKAIISVAEKIKIGKKKMPDETVNTPPEQQSAAAGHSNVTITPNTPIQFKLKGFISLVVTILGLFVGFYKLAIVPTIDDNKEHQKEMYQAQENFFNEKFDEVNSSIDQNTAAIRINTNTISNTNARFKDLNRSVESLSNSGGSFGSAISAVEVDSDTTRMVAENHE